MNILKCMWIEHINDTGEMISFIDLIKRIPLENLKNINKIVDHQFSLDDFGR